MSDDSPRIAHLFDEALRHPSPGFALGERLAAVFRDRHLVEEDGHLDIEGFARDGHVTVVARPGLYQHREWAWSEGFGPSSRIVIGWHTVTWNGSSHDVVHLRWPDTRYHSDRVFVLSDDRTSGEAFYAAMQRWHHEVRGEILVFSEGCFSKDEDLFASVRTASFDQLVLEGALVQQIRDDFTRFVASRPLYDDAGVSWRRGALLVGPPGNGKTLCIRALVRELGLPCLYVRSLEARYDGAQSSVAKVFARARSHAPCVIVLEDIDALLVESAKSPFLNELDGFAQNTGIITIASTNHPERLDPSIVERPSRFDRKYHFDLPTAETRGRYIALWNDRLKPALRIGETGRAQLAELTHGFSFAYIQEVFVATQMQWAHAPGDPLGIAVEQVNLLRAQMTRKQ